MMYFFKKRQVVLEVASIAKSQPLVAQKKSDNKPVRKPDSDGSRRRMLRIVENNRLM